MIAFIERSVLAQRGPVDCAPPEECETFLVATEPAFRWTEGQTQYGDDSCSLWPAWVKGERAWLLRRVWGAARGYCAEGTQDQVIPFEEGCRILIAAGRFLFPAPAGEPE